MGHRGKKWDDTFVDRFISRVYQKKLFFSDVAVGWQKVAVGVKTNSKTKIFKFCCGLTQIFLLLLWIRPKIPENCPNSRTTNGTKL